MTDTYKEQLLNYLTGNLQIDYGSDFPRFSEISYINNNLYTYIASKVVSPQTSSYKLIKGKDSNGEELDEQILYGIDSNDNSSFIVILNVMFQPIQFINKYASGTKFGVFEELIIDDDGKFYGVEYRNNTNTRRFVMLNNILVKAENEANFKVILRQSYNLPNSLQTGTINKLIKKPLGNKYLFCATTSSSYPLAVELTINVGMENEWVEYTYTSNYCSIAGAWASWNENDEMVFKLAALYTSGSSGYLYILVNGNDSITLDSTFNLPEPTASWIQAVVLNDEVAYLSYCDTNEYDIYKQYVYKITDTMELIFTSPNTDVAMPGALMKSTLYTDGFNVFVSFNVPNANDTIDYYMGIVYNDNVYYINFGDLTYTTSQLLYATNTFHQFNLYSYYLQLGDTGYKAISIFNNFNYNGLPYSSVNGLVPNSAILKNNVGSTLFARNLYNKVVSDNVTISTLEIPNTLMNYNLGSITQIAQQELISKTNQSLILNNEIIDKNIYEVVDINFYNTINMVNRNDLSNQVTNIEGAIRINQSVSNVMVYEPDYYKVVADKIKINYSDSTYTITQLDISTQIQINTTASGDKYATYLFAIYTPTDKDITNIQIISNDEETIYTTILYNFGRSKYYTITQDVRVE